ncbi:MAG TPA: DUF2059 domain-containing protein [Terriglobales bacterium]|nr:DUF2059 domain-containing protein [Terriglobales bacterium]
MKKTCLIVAISLMISLPVIAQQNPADTPATQADVEKYLEVTHARQMMDQMVEAMAKPMDQMLHEQYLKHKDVLPPDYEQRAQKSMHEMLAEMPWDKIIQAMMPAYQKHFTKGDLDAMTAFYSSSRGQKILHEMPGLMADSMQAMMPVIQQHMERVTTHMQQEMAAMLKEAEKAPAGSSAPQKR